MKKNKEYFTTGEFARIFGVKKQTLFHYDQCGIFRPDVTGENGYRYYSFAQLETFAVISMLRELDVSIAEIKEHMDRRSPESLISLLQSKRQQVDSKIAWLQWSKKYIDNKIRTTQEGLTAPLGQIVFENAPDEFMVTTDYKGADDEKQIMEAVGDHFAFCHSLGLYSAYPIGAMIHAASVTDAGYKYDKFYTVVHPDELRQAGVTDAAFDRGGNYIAIYDNHGYTNIHANCLKLLDYAADHGLKTADHFYEDVILDDLATDGYYNYLVKLSIKVE